MNDSLLLACPHCATLNRVPAAKLHDAPNCGRCKAALFTGQAIDLDETSFAAHSKSDLPLVVDFWAAWCGPCRSMAPNFARACSEFEPRARFAKVDTERQGGLAQRFAIRSIPSLLVFRQGREIARQAGAQDIASLRYWLQQVLAQP